MFSEGDMVYDRSGFCGIISKVENNSISIEWNSPKMMLPVRKMSLETFNLLLNFERFRIEKQ